MLIHLAGRQNRPRRLAGSVPDRLPVVGRVTVLGIQLKAADAVLGRLATAFQVSDRTLIPILLFRFSRRQKCRIG